jgi:hypothetical protein
LVYAGVSAPDKDLAGTPFATVTYAITKVAPVAGEGLFKLEEKDNKADILVAKALTDLFGVYTVTIQVSFHIDFCDKNILEKNVEFRRLMEAVDHQKKKILQLQFWI